MAVIISLSAQTGDDSGSLSKTITHHIVRIASVDASDEASFALIHHSVRKLGHATEYFVLAVLSLAALGGFRLSLRERLLWAFLLCFAFAFSDEWHQTFITGRSGEFLDVAIDMSGASVGLLLGGLVLGLRSRSRMRVEGTSESLKRE